MLQCRKALLFTALAILLALSPAPGRAEEGALEQFNKAMHDFNQKYYTASGSSANHFFSENVPEDWRRGVSNFFANMGEPVVAVSSLAQGDVDNAGIATRRFFYNLVYGYGGVFDRASEAGVKAEPRDMGQAICSIGLPDGPFLVLPFYGPSTVGDFFGSALPILAGYVALGEAFWLYRASSRVASTMADPAAPNASADGTVGEPGVGAPMKTDDPARQEQAYQSDKERYLAAREAVCSKHLLDAPAAEPAAIEEDSVRPATGPATGPAMGGPEGDAAPGQETAARPAPQGAADPAGGAALWASLPR